MGVFVGVGLGWGWGGSMCRGVVAVCVVWVFVLGGGLGWGGCGCCRAGEVAMELVWVFAPVTVSEIRDLHQLWFPCTMTSRSYGTRKPSVLQVTVGRNRNWSPVAVHGNRYWFESRCFCHSFPKP